ncbi:Uncharacterised protein [BD1-7 clade bacterium]|uniref:D-inositol-3-phosphate glycosyltransferase n=1 Tax=BD1-7 clade bacterium TaxID=2029982 RepID=A0A5S9MUT9_9GAMM|nr:Uncharacterised protein [BD1-7 clade bacterium]CAA0083823.1 Uncharacterised protein [BD1-7 clade bacterium]
MGASSRLRSLQYVPKLVMDGCTVDVYPLFDDQYLQQLYSVRGRSKLSVFRLYIARLKQLFGIRKYDVIWIEYELFPYAPAFFEALLRIFRIPFFVDYDDAVFHNYDLSSNSVVRVLLGTKIDKVMSRARCVIVGNDYLKKRAEIAGARHVEIIPTVVDTQRYSVAIDEKIDRELVVGWIGSPSTQKYVVSLKGVLKEFCIEGRARLVLVGASEEVLSDLSGINASIEQWTEDSEVDLVGGFDIGIMPLKDGPWEKGKCGYKLIQYMASGKPVIASPVGVNTEIVEKNACGFLADSSEEWVHALRVLLIDAEQRKQFGLNGRRAVEQHYSLQAQAPRLIRIFKEL